MVWLILAGILGIVLFLLYRAWQVWETRFAHRHEFDAEHLAMLMAQREEFELPAASPEPPPPRSHHHSRLPHRTTPPKTAPAVAQAAAQPQPARTSGAARQPLLGTTEQELYLRLHSELPGYPLLACVDIASLLAPTDTPAPRVQADFVLCKKDFTPAVVILLERAPANPLHDRAEALLRQHHLRVLRWPIDALPSREQMRHQIFKPKSA